VRERCWRGSTTATATSVRSPSRSRSRSEARSTSVSSRRCPGTATDAAHPPEVGSAGSSARQGCASGGRMPTHECFPYLRVRDGAAAIEFYVRAFEGRELFRLVDPSDGRVGHAEVELAPGVVIMLSAEYPEMGILGPGEGRPAVSSIHLHVDD